MTPEEQQKFEELKKRRPPRGLSIKRLLSNRAVRWLCQGATLQRVIPKPRRKRKLAVAVKWHPRKGSERVNPNRKETPDQLA